jgi:Rrf2 family protein
MLSQRARYALRALVYLARRTGDGPAPIAEIARESPAPHKFLEAILLDLKRHRLLVSARGRAGGYALARPATAISYADVIRAIDGPLALAPCASRTAYSPCDTCPSVEACPIRGPLLEARDAVAATLERWTLEQAATKFLLN